MNTKSILSLMIASVLLSACGGGGGGGSDSSDTSQDTGQDNGYETPVVTQPDVKPPIITPNPDDEDKKLNELAAQQDIDDLNCLVNSENLTGTGDDVAKDVEAFKKMVALTASNSKYYEGSGEFGFLGQEIYTFDAYMGKDLGDSEWRYTVPEDIVSIKISTNDLGDRQSFVYTNFLNTTAGTPATRQSDKTLVQTTYAPCHGYSQKSLNNPFPLSKAVSVTQRYNPATKELLVAVQDENDTGAAKHSPKQYYIFDVVDVSGKLISDYMPRQILDMARYGVSRFTAYSEITSFPAGSVMLKAKSVLLPEQFTGFRMNQVDYFSETFETLDAFNSFIANLSMGMRSLEGDAGNNLGTFNLKYSITQGGSNYIKTFDFNRSESIFLNGTQTNAATHQPSTVYNPDFNIDTSELGRSYFNTTAGKAIHDLMKAHIYD